MSNSLIQKGIGINVEDHPSDARLLVLALDFEQNLDSRTTAVDTRHWEHQRHELFGLAERVFEEVRSFS